MWRVPTPTQNFCPCLPLSYFWIEQNPICKIINTKKGPTLTAQEIANQSIQDQINNFKSIEELTVFWILFCPTMRMCWRWARHFAAIVPLCSQLNPVSVLYQSFLVPCPPKTDSYPALLQLHNPSHPNNKFNISNPFEKGIQLNIIFFFINLWL